MTKSPELGITEICEVCSETFVRPPGRRQKRCGECRLRALSDNLESQHSRSGPLYEKTVRKAKAFWDAEAKRLKLSA